MDLRPTDRVETQVGQAVPPVAQQPFRPEPIPGKPSDLIRKVDAVYPAAALRAGIRGPVRLKILIGVEGRVLGVMPFSGPKELYRAATEAVKQ